jgi:hypothetical protein
MDQKLIASKFLEKSELEDTTQQLPLRAASGKAPFPQVDAARDALVQLDVCCQVHGAAKAASRGD